jgi:hypothetical protein
MRGSKLISYIVLTIVHIADIEPPKTTDIAKLIAIPPIVAIIDVSPAASNCALVLGSIYSYGLKVAVRGKVISPLPALSTYILEFENYRVTFS